MTGRAKRLLAVSALILVLACAAVLVLLRGSGALGPSRRSAASAAADAARAKYDGEAAGRWVKAMVEDGYLTPQEEAQILRILPSYYAATIEHRPRLPWWRPILARRESRSTRLIAPDAQEFVREAQQIKTLRNMELAGIVFWPEPSNKVTRNAAVLSRQAVRAIYNDLYAAKGQFPELAQFDRAHVTLTGTSLSYAPGGLSTYVKVTNPTIGISFGEPTLVPTQMDLPRLLFLRQKLQVGRFVAVKDKSLYRLVKLMVEQRTGSLESAERALGGEPIRDKW